MIGEAAQFYLDEQKGALSAYLKAILIEGFAILFSLSRCKSRLLTWAQKLVVVLLCAFTLLLKAASSDTYRVQALRQTLSNLDSDETVRAEAADALQYRGLSPDMLDGYRSVLRREKSPLVDKNVLKHLPGAQKTNRNAKAELEWFIQNCGHPDLCQYAAQLN